jgi:hypothetical protein
MFVSMMDVLNIDTIGAELSDTFPFEDNAGNYFSINKNAIDAIGRGYARNGTWTRNGGIYRASEQIIDLLSFHFEEEGISERAAACLKRDGVIRRDGVYARNGYAEESMLDFFAIGKRYHYFRDGAYARDGGIQRQGMVLIPLPDEALE